MVLLLFVLFYSTRTNYVCITELIIKRLSSDKNYHNIRMISNQIYKKEHFNIFITGKIYRLKYKYMQCKMYKFAVFLYYIPLEYA